MCHQRSALPHSACRYESRFSPKRLFIRFLHHKIACQTYTRLTISPLYSLSAQRQQGRAERVPACAPASATGGGRFDLNTYLPVVRSSIAFPPINDRHGY